MRAVSRPPLGEPIRDRAVGSSAPPSRLYRRFVEEVTAAGLPAGPGDATPVTDADLAGLPDVVQQYLRFMAVVGRPRDWSFRARFIGRFRGRPRLGWMPAEAWQYNSGLEIARVFVMRVRLAGIVPMIGRDTYLDGHGRTLGKLLGSPWSTAKAKSSTSASSPPISTTPCCWHRRCSSARRRRGPASTSTPST